MTQMAPLDAHACVNRLVDGRLGLCGNVVPAMVARHKVIFSHGSDESVLGILAPRSAEWARSDLRALRYLRPAL
jgi:hypothetical protein